MGLPERCVITREQQAYDFGYEEGVKSTQDELARLRGLVAVAASGMSDRDVGDVRAALSDDED